MRSGRRHWIHHGCRNHDHCASGWNRRLCHRTFASARDAANALLERGAAEVLVTDGGKTAAHARQGEILTAEPPQVLVTRVTGAGDTFMAAHIAAQSRGEAPQAALETALAAAAAYVSGDVPS